MTVETYRNVWFIGQLIWLAGIIVIIFGFFGNHRAAEMSWEGSYMEHREDQLERFRSAEIVVNAGTIITGTGAMIIIVHCFAGWLPFIVPRSRKPRPRHAFVL